MDYIPEYPFVPMLLDTAALPFDDRNYAFEVKYDGVRMTARFCGGETALYNRRLNERTRRYPEIAAQVKALCAASGAGATVLDGEIIALSDGGLPDFYRVMKRDRVEIPTPSFVKEIPVYFMVFDITEFNGSPLYGTEYALRREVLESVFNTAERGADGAGKNGGGLETPNIKLTDSIAENGGALFAAAKNEGLEGIVAKRLDSVYSPDTRSRDWLKIKIDDYRRPQSS